MMRLLCIVNSMNTGGAETFLMKLYRTVDRNRYQFDFCVSEPERGIYETEIEAMGGKVIHIVGKSKAPLKSAFMLFQLIRTGKYQYVMRVGQHSMTVIDLVVAKAAGAKQTIYRSANSSVGHDPKKVFLHWIFAWMPRIVPDIKIAPSDVAAEFMFGTRAVQRGEVLMLNNAIDTKQFVFDPAVRAAVRLELGLSDEFAVCHIGRFAEQKNHLFLLEVFMHIHEKQPNAQLFLVGQGELEQVIRIRAEELKLLDHIRFLGVRSDIPQLLMAMDVMVFPSYYEGMPNTVIEAQATGLHCVISDRITKQVAISDCVKFLPLEATAETWADFALQSASPYNRADMTRCFQEKGYEISSVAKRFCDAVFV